MVAVRNTEARWLGVDAGSVKKLLGKLTPLLTCPLSIYFNDSLFLFEEMDTSLSPCRRLGIVKTRIWSHGSSTLCAQESLGKFIQMQIPESCPHNSGSSGQGKAGEFAFWTSTPYDFDAEMVQITLRNHLVPLASVWLWVNPSISKPYFWNWVRIHECHGFAVTSDWHNAWESMLGKCGH